LLHEWWNELNLRWAEATALARIGALLHDLCHIALGHTLEDDLEVLLPHDANWPRFCRLWQGLAKTARDAIEGAHSCFDAAGVRRNLISELQPLILPKLAKAQEEGGGETPRGLAVPNADGDFPPRLELKLYPFVGDVVGNTICADLLDYIHRDHYYTGLPVAVGTRFTVDFYIRESADRRFGRHMVVRIHRDGRRREDVVSELIKLLRYRYELTERALAHHSKLAGDAMLGKMVDIWSNVILFEQLCQDSQLYARLTDTIKGFDLYERLDWVEREAPEVYGKAHKARREVLEDVFLRKGDDGLLETLSELEDRGDPADSYRKTVRDIAQAVLNRRLFKPLGHSASPGTLAVAEEVFEQYGRNHSKRRRLERDASLAAGRNEHELALWVPDPRMRLKVADVLVDSEDQPVAPLGRVNSDAGHIAERHKQLWAVSVFGSPDLRGSRRGPSIALAYIKSDMQISMTDRSGKTVQALEDALTEIVLEESGLEASQDAVATAVQDRVARYRGGTRQVLNGDRIVDEVLEQFKGDGTSI
jgi:HD superfamily phosphohydrolase